MLVIILIRVVSNEPLRQYVDKSVQSMKPFQAAYVSDKHTQTVSLSTHFHCNTNTMLLWCSHNTIMMPTQIPLWCPHYVIEMLIMPLWCPHNSTVMPTPVQWNSHIFPLWCPHCAIVMPLWCHCDAINLSSLQALQQDLTDNKSSVDELITSLEIFLRDHKDRLGPDQQDLIQRGIYELRSNFDKANYKAQDWLRRMEDQVYKGCVERTCLKSFIGLCCFATASFLVLVHWNLFICSSSAEVIWNF